MRFVISNDIRKNNHLILILVFSLLFFLLFWVTDFLLQYEIGFSYSSIVKYYQGSEEDLRPPKTYKGLLEEAHFHLFSMAILLITITHLILFTPLRDLWKKLLIILSFLSAFLDVSSGWLILYISSGFAYIKMISFHTLQISLGIMLAVILWSLLIPNKNNFPHY